MTEAVAPAPIPAGYGGYGTKAYRAYVLFALVVVYTFNFIDRVVVGIIQEPIRKEFGLSDTQLGLLGGPTFAVLYTLLGIPIARLAERKNRIVILSACVGLWSLMTALCGFAGSYATLLLARIGVSVGEAGCTPSAQSVIGDYFPADKRSTAFSIYALGVPLGSMAAAIGGGFIAEYMGWREAFWVLGAPGLILAVLVVLTVKEPPRQATAAETPSLKEAFKVLAKKSTFWHVALGSAAASFTGYGVGQFTNSFLMRTHELGQLQASQITGVIIGLFGGLGTVGAGWLCDKIRPRHPNALAWLPALGFFVSAPLYMVGYTSGSLYVAVPALAVGHIFQYLYLGPMYALSQGVVHPRMRATAVALLLFIVNIIGYGLGPPVIGAVSDLLANANLAPAGLSVEACKTAAADVAATCAKGTAFGLQYAIVIGYLGFLWAAVHFLLCWRPMQKDWHQG